MVTLLFVVQLAGIADNIKQSRMAKCFENAITACFTTCWIFDID